MAAPIVGRDGQLAQVHALLDDEESTMRALVIDGEAGIGKTTLWRTGVAAARSTPITVLAAQPGQTESTLPYAALGDLLQPLLDGHLERLPEAQRVALEVALQMRPADRAPEELAVARACLDLLAGATGDVLLAVDDVQWLDPPSERVLEFAVRRLGASPIRLLIARRSEHELPAPFGLDRVLEPDRLDARRLGPMTLGELGDLVRERFGIRLLRPRLAELREASGGNPFYALEIMRTTPPDGFHAPKSLTAALAARLSALPAQAREAALLAAAAVRPTVSLVVGAAGTNAGLAQAAEAEVLALEGERLRFTHPLLATVAYDSAPPWKRRTAHLRLAEVSAGEERAWNLARGTDGPDAEVAAELEAAAATAAARGGFDAAAALAEHAVRVTPSGDERARVGRLVSAAESHQTAGDYGRSREILEGLAVALDPGPLRADVLRRLAAATEDTAKVVAMCRQALDEAADDPLVRANVLTSLADFLWIAGEHVESLELRARAIGAAEESDDPLVIATALAELCLNQMLRALPWDRDAMARALEFEKVIDAFPRWRRPSFQLGVIKTWTDDPTHGRPLLVEELERLVASGQIGAQWVLRLRLAQCDLRSGSWGDALTNARTANELVAQTGYESEIVVCEAVLAVVLAHLGALDEAEEHARRAQALAEEQRIEYRLITSRGALGFVLHCRDDDEAALAYLTPARESLVRHGFLEFSTHAVVENEIEALVALGRLDEAEEVAGLVADAGQPAGRTWHRAIASRGRALVASARGDVDGARAAVADALSAHEVLPQPFELGRTLLAQGQIERRAKSRAAARDALTRALETFDELGAAIWAEKAAAELARIPGRARASSELTETERRVAELVRDGLSNKEVAARLFITVRTVEANLTKVYAKLGIRSRTELASRLRA